MKNLKASFLAFILSLSPILLSGQNSFINVDQFGYHNEDTKVAILSDPQIGFNANESYQPSAVLEVVEATSNQVVFTGSPTIWNNGNTDLISGDRGWWFDFSSLTTTGSYYINDAANNVQSPVFEINSNPYGEVLKVATKMYYYNRCNMDKVVPYADANWVDGNNFDKPLQDYNCRYIYDPGNPALEKDLSGGWFDAGDYNKYITFTYTVVHNLLAAYEKNPSLFGDDWNIPESNNGVPDIIDELKWELDWMIKMTNTDGSVHIKMGSQNYSDNTSAPPSLNVDQRFYGPTCTSASVTIASTFAHAALVLKDIPSLASYANTLETMAISCYDYVIPFFSSNTLETNCDDNSIISGNTNWGTANQKEALLNASIYLFALTGDQNYHQFILDHTANTEPLASDTNYGGYWNPGKLPLEDALFFYTTMANANAALSADIINSLTVVVSNNWNNIYGMNDLTLYRDFVPSWVYDWGSSQVKAQYAGLNLLVAEYNINNDSENHQQKAKEVLRSYHGVNPLGMVYLSNMSDYGAERSANEIYHTWFNDQTDYDNALTSLYGPAPGYVPGGPNPNFTVSTISPPSGQPLSKSYLDFNTGWPDNSWEITEPAIYYQAAYIRLLSQVMGLSNSNSERQVEISAMLQGAYIPATGLMKTDLLSNNLLPLSQPYNGNPWNYNGNESLASYADFPSNTVDWVLIEARTGTPNLTTANTVVVETKAALLLSNGNIVAPSGAALSFQNLNAEAYYFAVRHRNHLDVLSANSVSYNPDTNSIISYDFTNGVNQAFGIQQLQILPNGQSALFMGDYSPNGVVLNTDYDVWAVEPAVLNTYAQSDGNLDGVVQTTDYDLWFLNSAKLGVIEIQY